MDELQILIADDKAVVRWGLRMLLERHDGWVVCGEAVDGVEAIERVEALKPDVILLDISMPRLDGLTATPIIRDKAPNTAIVVLTLHESVNMARLAAYEGATAYVTKSSITSDLVPILESIHKDCPFRNIE